MRRCIRSLSGHIRSLEQALTDAAGRTTTASYQQTTRTISRSSTLSKLDRKRFIPDGAPAMALTPEEVEARRPMNLLIATALLTAAGGAYYTSINARKPPTLKEPIEEDLVNWSGTHECHVKRFFQPETVPELELLVQHAHEQGTKLRCVGSGLSPNALAFETEGMVSLALMDKVLNVDQNSGQIRVQAGARVQDVADYIRRYGLTLPNYASIKEQTLGGLTQVGAHGTGTNIPTIDDYVVGMKLITPALGTIELSKDKDPELFHMARVGLGCLGIVAELTLQCVPAHKLIEHTTVATLAEIKKNHTKWLAENKHMRYMWLPSTDTIVVVKCNPLTVEEESKYDSATSTSAGSYYTEEQRLEPLRNLLATKSPMPQDEIHALSWTQLRDALLAIDALNPSWVVQVNKAEAEYWKRNQGVHIDWSDQILGFDCGGEQWVLEMAFPNGTQTSPAGRDIAYMEEVNALIKKYNIAAPAPIEQRWSCGSASPMSPSHGSPNDLFSWVGIIMYLPEDNSERSKITAAFKQYGALIQERVAPKFNAVEHWAKIEVPETDKGLVIMKQRLKKRYDLEKFAAARRRLDPKNILGNILIDAVL